MIMLAKVLGSLSLFLLLCYCEETYSLNCETGATAHTFVHSVDEWSSKQCEDPTHICIRIEAEFMIMGGLVKVTTEHGACASYKTCHHECRQALQDFYIEAKKTGAYMPFDVYSVSANTEKCDSICCHDHGCNRDSIEEIRLRPKTPSTTITTTTTKSKTTARPTLLSSPLTTTTSRKSRTTATTRGPKSHTTTTARGPKSHKTTTRIPKSHKTTTRRPKSHKTTTRIPKSHKTTTRIPKSHKTTTRRPKSRTTSKKRRPKSHKSTRRRRPKSHSSTKRRRPKSRTSTRRRRPKSKTTTRPTRLSTLRTNTTIRISSTTTTTTFAADIKPNSQQDEEIVVPDLQSINNVANDSIPLSTTTKSLNITSQTKKRKNSLQHESRLMVKATTPAGSSGHVALHKILFFVLLVSSFLLI